jgi:hypothetical protein
VGPVTGKVMGLGLLALAIRSSSGSTVDGSALRTGGKVRR